MPALRASVTQRFALSSYQSPAEYFNDWNKAIQYFDKTFPEMTSKYGFKCSFNPTFSTASSKEWI